MSDEGGVGVVRKKLKIESNSGALGVGLEAVKFSFLLNGAGAVALLGLLTADTIREIPAIVLGIASALTFFSIGAALAPLTLMFAFFGIHAQYSAVSKFNNGSEARLWIWKLLLAGAVTCGICSVGLFIFAVWTLGPILASTK
jgi:hypothetical protein